MQACDLPLGIPSTQAWTLKSPSASFGTLAYRSEPSYSATCADTGWPASSREDTSTSSNRGCPAISRISSAPVWPRAPTIPTVLASTNLFSAMGWSSVFEPVAQVRRRPFACSHRSIPQRGFAHGAVRHRAFDLLESVEPVPERPPPLLPDTAVGFGVVEDVDRVVVPRAPEQARRFLAHHLPHRAAETLALGVIQPRETGRAHV